MKITRGLVSLIVLLSSCGIEEEVYEAEKKLQADLLVLQHQKEVTVFQEEINEHYADTADSPLLPEDLAKFTALEFFKVDPVFNVIADFTRIVSEPFEMQTSTDRKPIYEKWGEAKFSLDGKECTLSLFQSHSSREDSVWKHYLFLPFTDLTSGNDTYGGGRFIDVLMPDSGKVRIDFNQAYNPYCAYNHKYSCPIPPEENFLEVRVEAGVKAWEEH